MTNSKQVNNMQLTMEEIKFEVQEKIKDEILEQIVAEIEIKERSQEKKELSRGDQEQNKN
jgi:hypothetical protein